jgi:hypothetical protein
MTSFLPFTVGVSFVDVGFQILLLQDWFWDTTVLRICFEILLLQKLRYYCSENLLWDITVTEFVLRYYCSENLLWYFTVTEFEILLFSEFALRFYCCRIWDTTVLRICFEVTVTELVLGYCSSQYDASSSESVSGDAYMLLGSVWETGSLKCLIWSTEFYGAETWHFET